MGNEEIMEEPEEKAADYTIAELGQIIQSTMERVQNVQSWEELDKECGEGLRYFGMMCEKLGVITAAAKRRICGYATTCEKDCVVCPL